MDVIILAGGLGTRLRSVVSDLPKCMAPICEKPFLYYLLKYLTRFQIENVILSVGYLNEYIIEWINENKHNFPFEFKFTIEEEPLGTGGAIKLALTKAITEEICILNGDTYFNVNLNLLRKQHIESKASYSIALKPMKDFERYGTVEINLDHKITKFKEKEYCTEGLINGGISIINKNTILMDNLPEKFSFETEVLQSQVLIGNIYGFTHDEYFIDIGIPEDYNKANSEFQKLTFIK